MVVLFINNKAKVNSFLLILFLFMSSICLPINRLIKSGMPVWIMTFLILVVSIIINKNYYKKNFIIIFIFFIILFLTNLIFYEFKKIIIGIFLEFIKFGIIPLFLSSHTVDFKYLKIYWYKFGKINFIIWAILSRGVINKQIDYMFFGTYMTYSFLIFIYYYFERGKKVDLVLSFLSFLFIFILGNRASWLICLFVFIFFIIKKRGYKFIILVGVIVFPLVTYIYNNSLNILIFIKNIIAGLGINSYNIDKLIKIYDIGFLSTVSRRDAIYNISMDIIRNNNMRPMGIGYFTYYTGEIYPHNIILEILISFGFIGFFVLIVSLVYLIIKYKYIDKEIKDLINILIIFLSIRMSLSSSLFQEVPLWITVGIVIFNNNCKKNNIINSDYKLDKG